ncbi:hypothetical protein [Streptomyces sp. NPDC048590]|uniref:hypothetical protein n=1 Tax=Streptomyces sp. NPDC048590 TaxID=3365574 RepID=UPI0037247053
MSRPEQWDPRGTLSGGPSLYEFALEVGRRPPGRRAPGRLPGGAPRPSRRTNTAADTTSRMVATAAYLTRSGPDHLALSVLDGQLRRIVWGDHERSLEAGLRRRGLPSDRLRLLGGWFATRGEHPNAVRFGILLLGTAGHDGDSGVLKTLGILWEFSAQACDALVRSGTDPHRALFELARQAEGWARVDAVRGLVDASDPEITLWLVRDSCTGDTLDSYLALTAARTGDLAGILARDTLDEETLDGAGRLIEALTDIDGPGPALAWYDDALRALEGCLVHFTAGALTLRRLWTLLSVHRFLHSSDANTTCRKSHGWQRIRHRVAAVVHDPASREIVLLGLTAEDRSVFRLAAWTARLTDIPVRPALLRRVESEPDNASAWTMLADDCTGEEIEAVVAAAARLLPLRELRSGPTTETGLGRGYDTDGILGLVVSRLDQHPGHGWELVETALGNRTCRNRRTALRVLSSWPTGCVPSTARHALLTAAAREPLPELAEAMAREARRL